MRLFSKTLLATLLTATSGVALASAFQLHETSTSGLGRAYAGEAAIADNASVVATNPALMTLLKQAQVSVGAIYVDPNVNLTKGSFNGGVGDLSHNNIVPNAVVPQIYAVYPINDKFVVGAGVNVNYGMKSKFNENYSAGFFGGETTLKTFNFNLSTAYRITDHLSFGLGANAVYGDAEIKRNVGQLLYVKAGAAAQMAQYYAGQAALAQQQGDLQKAAQLAQAAKKAGAEAQQYATSAPSVKPNASVAELKGKGWGYGWNAGLVYEFNENNRIGFAYHSNVDVDFKGDYRSDIEVAKNGPGALTLNLPAYWEISGYHKLLPRFAVSYSWKQTNWSHFKQLRATNGNTELFQKPEYFMDTNRVALGFSYDVNDKLVVRTGVAYDETAVETPYHSISIPDTNRVWYSVGLTYQFTPNLSVDAGYSRIEGKTINFDEYEKGQKVANFTSKSSANLYGLNINYRF